MIIKRVCCWLVDVGSWLLNPFRLPVCRFEPTCSQYAKECLHEHGLGALGLIVRRLLKCHPWGSFGLDPAPTKRKS